MIYEDKIASAYKRYREWHELEQDKNCDYDSEPYTNEEFEECYRDWNEDRR